MADQYRRAFLQRQRALRRLNGLRQRGQRVLHGSGLETLRLKSGDHLGPARAVGKKSVHKHDVANFRHGLRRGGTLEKRTGRAGSHHAHEVFDGPSEPPLCSSDRATPEIW